MATQTSFDPSMTHARGNAFLSKVLPGLPHSSLPNWLATMSDMGQSWQRCVERHHLNPGALPTTEQLTARELAEQNQPLEEFLPLLDNELDFVQSVLSGQVHCINLSNPVGIILKHRSGNQHDDLPTEMAGSIWSESLAGTNGVGTCSVEKRPVIVVGEDHFFKSFSDLTCVSAPVHSTSDGMLGILNVTMLNPEPRLEAVTMLAGLVQRMALRIENDIFCSVFRDRTLVRLRDDNQQFIIALDGDQRIVGSNAAARRRFDLNDQDNLWSVFEKDERILRTLRSGGGKSLFTRRDSGNDPLSGEIHLPPARRTYRQTRRSSEIKPGSVFSDLAASRQSGHDRPGSDTVLASVLKPGGPTMDQLLRANSIGLPVLLLGETGSGKDTIARALHEKFEASDAPFVAFNCASVPESLIDSELFGYAAGAFTGASRGGQQGRIEQAEGGTLFLDEIGDMPLPLQTRLLRFLETREVSPLGAGRVRRVETRIIAATNLDLPKRVAEGLFRQDLYYRLAGIVIEVPPLRARSDFADLVRHIIESQFGGRHPIQLTEAAMTRLQTHSWPGNVRELRHLLLRAACQSDDGVIDADHLSFVPSPRSSDDTGPLDDPRPDAMTDSSANDLGEAERQAIRAAFAAEAGDIDRTAARLGISRSTLYRKMRRHNIQRGRIPVG